MKEILRRKDILQLLTSWTGASALENITSSTNKYGCFENVFEMMVLVFSVASFKELVHFFLTYFHFILFNLVFVVFIL